jgi:hypothetical protein
MSHSTVPPPFSSPTRHRHLLIDSLWIAAWASSLAAVVAWPHLAQSPSLGDDLTRSTIRLSLGYYGIGASLLLWLHRDEWHARTGRGRLARWCWTFAWATYLVHLAMAFHYYHHWSHADAMRHTEDRSGFGIGIVVSDLFTLAWSADVVWWWLAPGRYAQRPAWIGRCWHGFMVFVIFNATVVYEEGLIRWAGLGLLAWLAAVRVLAWTAARNAMAEADDGGKIVRREPGC